MFTRQAQFQPILISTQLGKLQMVLNRDQTDPFPARAGKAGCLHSLLTANFSTLSKPLSQQETLPFQGAAGPLCAAKTSYEILVQNALGCCCHQMHRGGLLGLSCSTAAGVSRGAATAVGAGTGGEGAQAGNTLAGEAHGRNAPRGVHEVPHRRGHDCCQEARRGSGCGVPARARPLTMLAAKLKCFARAGHARHREMQVSSCMQLENSCGALKLGTN